MIKNTFEIQRELPPLPSDQCWEFSILGAALRFAMDKDSLIWYPCFMVGLSGLKPVDFCAGQRETLPFPEYLNAHGQFVYVIAPQDELALLAEVMAEDEIHHFIDKLLLFKDGELCILGEMVK